MDEIVINRIIVFLFFAISVGLTYLIIRKSNRKSKDKDKGKAGCLTAFFIWVPISLLVGLTPFMLLLGTSTVKQLYQLASDSDFKPYTAQVVRYEDTYTSEERDSDGRTRYVEMGTPVVTFTVESGQELERALPFATNVGGDSSYDIRYKASTDEIIVTDVYIVVKIIALIIFFVIAVFAYWGIYGYLTDRPMKNYGNYLAQGLLYGVILTMTMGLCAGLIYGVLTKELPLWVQVLCIFFALSLVMVIVRIFRSMFRSEVKDPLKRRRKTTYRKDY
ncbi:MULTISPECIES: ethanolamine utilization protein EutH [unclassified Capnocytophaga]|uniref:ethanolamine utilization protein EutH n=1 Tax=unclassified Capnocytophaga TaxID=2640652 RepID=UPI000202F843|nr:MULTISPECIES: ethanolamine utilization protein EutH [unclassified Capnocytophaga]EGD33661.1 hypothetical protein HMPREF9071_1823 [Capnocytophaga sp. oral taxon 338 str. F0234]MEB3004489.1 hypothetical protein [Capnocytophaga sp. G2]